MRISSPNLRFLMGLSFTLILFLLVQCKNLAAESAEKTGSVRFLHEEVINDVMAGNLRLAFGKQAWNTIQSGLSSKDARFFKRLFNLCFGATVLLIQSVDLSFKNDTPFPVSCHLNIPETIKGRQNILWQGVALTDKFTLDRDNLRVRIEEPGSFTITVASVIRTIPDSQQELLDYPFPPMKEYPGVARNYSASIRCLRDLYWCLIKSFGEYHHTEREIALPFILMNPYQPLRCTEFARLSQAILEDCGLATEIAVGIILDYTTLNRFNVDTGHCWIRCQIGSQSVEFDPSAGGRIGLTAYSQNLSRAIMMGSSRQMGSIFTAAVFDLFGNRVFAIKSRRITVFEFQSPFIKLFETAETILNGQPARDRKPTGSFNAGCESCKSPYCHLPVGGIFGVWAGPFLGWYER